MFQNVPGSVQKLHTRAQKNRVAAEPLPCSTIPCLPAISRDADNTSAHQTGFVTLCIPAKARTMKKDFCGQRKAPSGSNHSSSVCTPPSLPPRPRFTAGIPIWIGILALVPAGKQSRLYPNTLSSSPSDLDDITIIGLGDRRIIKESLNFHRDQGLIPAFVLFFRTGFSRRSHLLVKQLQSLRVVRPHINRKRRLLCNRVYLMASIDQADRESSPGGDGRANLTDLRHRPSHCVQRAGVPNAE